MTARDSRLGSLALGLSMAFMLTLGMTGCNEGASISERQGSKPQETVEEVAEVPEEVLPAPVMVTGRPEQGARLLLPESNYTLASAYEVGGRQGIAYSEGNYYVSDSAKLLVYDGNWKLTQSNEDPFVGFEDKVNHIGDIDVYKGEIYAGVEYFMDGEASNIQIAVYDAKTLELARTYSFDRESGQNEVSGIAVDPDSGSVWMCSWADGESGRYLYRYDLASGSYLGKVHLQAPPQWIQGIAYRNGWLYISADDGTADMGEADHIWRCRVDVEQSAWPVMLERTLDDLKMPGEIEGISFDTDKNQMLVSHNHGARIVLGMPRGFYEGFEDEVHEVYAYDMSEA